MQIYQGLERSILLWFYEQYDGDVGANGNNKTHNTWHGVGKGSALDTGQSPSRFLPRMGA